MTTQATYHDQVLLRAREISDTHAFETAYLYDVGEMKRRLGLLTNHAGEMCFDASWLPIAPALAALLPSFPIRVVCTSDPLVRLVSSCGVSRDRIFRMAVASGQPLSQPNCPPVHVAFCATHDAEPGVIARFLGDPDKITPEDADKLLEGLVPRTRARIVCFQAHPRSVPNQPDEDPIFSLVKRVETWSQKGSGNAGKIGAGLDVTPYLLSGTIMLIVTTLYTKTVRGEQFAVCSAGTNVLWDAGQGLNPRRHKYPIFSLSTAPSRDAPASSWTVTGPLCTPADVLAIQYPMSSPRPGDRLLIPCNRAELYFSPLHFILHERPTELILDTSCITSVLETDG